MLALLTAPRGWRLLTTTFLATAACAALASAQGGWVGPFDWTSQLKPPGCNIGSGYPELAHAALIPVGEARGMILLWSNECGVSTTNTTAWIFDPQSPHALYKVMVPVGSDTFCSSHTWLDTQAGPQLLIAGAFNDQQQLQQSWLFNPSLLVKDTTVSPPVFQGNPWSGPFAMSRKHYYPTVIGLSKFSETSDGTGYTIPAGAAILLGGPSLTGPVGMPYWEFFFPMNPAWSKLFHANGSPPPPLPPPAGLEPYYPITTPPNPPPDLELDSYPRAFQLGERDPSGIPITAARNIFVAGDVDTDEGNPYNNPGRSWLIRPPSKTLTAPHNWELHGTQTAGGLADFFNDRQYDPAVLLHLRNPTGVPQIAENRVLVFGGFYQDPSANPPIPKTARKTVQEYVPNIQPESLGQWIPKADMLTERAYLNGVVLPTRQIFLVGGAKAFDQGNVAVVPVDKPLFAELYDAGEKPSPDTSFTQPVTPPNVGIWSVQPPQCPPNGPSDPPPDHTYRLYHSFAGLLPDGSVFLAGGHQHSCVNSEYTGEIFRPAYMSYSRPIINVRSLGTKTYGQSVQFEVDVYHDNVERIVLTRPASVTHHCDYDQRLVELEFVAPAYTNPNDVLITVTAVMPHASWAPPGWYMLWVIEKGTIGGSSTLIPSEACWVQLQ